MTDTIYETCGCRIIYYAPTLVEPGGEICFCPMHTNASQTALELAEARVLLAKALSAMSDAYMSRDIRGEMVLTDCEGTKLAIRSFLAQAEGRMEI